MTSVSAQQREEMGAPLPGGTAGGGWQSRWEQHVRRSRDLVPRSTSIAVFVRAGLSARHTSERGVEDLAREAVAGATVEQEPGVAPPPSDQPVTDVLLCPWAVDLTDEWRTAVSRIKSLVRPGGLVVTATAPRHDGSAATLEPRWHVGEEDLRIIFGDCSVESLETDTCSGSSFLRARLPAEPRFFALDGYALRAAEGGRFLAAEDARRLRILASAAAACQEDLVRTRSELEAAEAERLALRSEVDRIYATKTMRYTRTLRSAYSLARSTVRRSAR